MNREDLEFIANLVKRRSGLVFTAEKEYLLESRLAPLARREGFASLDELIAKLRVTGQDRLAWQVTEALTTNETYFFRDKRPFELLEQEVLPRWVKARRPGDTLRIWSAACSSGQEPYSIAMILDENSVKMSGFNYEIVATDICTKMLEKAKAGLYSQFEVQRGLPVRTLVKYFEKVDEMWRIDPRLATNISFRRLNLVEDFRTLGKFDVVFCRNVLIYFDQAQKTDILSRVAAQSQRDGYLILGAAETVLGMTDAFETVKGLRSLYQRAGAQAVKAA